MKAMGCPMAEAKALKRTFVLPYRYCLTASHNRESDARKDLHLPLGQVGVPCHDQAVAGSGRQKDRQTGR
jgi:hypothetical protein